MTLRFRLTMAFIAVIVVANVVLTWVSVQYVGRAWQREVQKRVRLDLNSARAAFDSRLALIRRFLEALALDRRLAEAAGPAGRDAAAELLGQAFARAGRDFLCLLGADGRVLERARNPGQRGDDMSANPLVAAALGQRRPVSGAMRLSHELLQREGADLAERARVALVPTPAARHSTDQERSDGLVIAAAVPVLDDRGELAGVLYGGDLLNRCDQFVDAIRDEVFSGETHQGRVIGTVTVFLDDLRIATNVRTTAGTRAIGTRLSAEVGDQVLGRGQVWAQRAFVVNNWYISAYEPIRDPAGQIIGVLYAGLLEAPFLLQRRVTGGVFVSTVGAIALASVALLVLVTRRVLQPIERITQMSRKVVGGDLAARVGIRPRGELGVLCAAVDAMADAVAEREQQLKVATRQQIVRSEKLASIGRLAAGIAHEINNPLTAVLTFATLVREGAHLTDQDRTDLDVVVKETTRAAQIVRGLLDFARERPSQKEALDLNEVVRQTLRLVRSQKQFRQIVTREELAEALSPIHADRNQIQQVLLNLALNACEAMPEGGTLSVGTAARDGWVALSVADTGCGIKAEHRALIFDPFFTTKPVGKGTGLGLSVSYGIVEQHGGRWEIDSEEGRGSRFTVLLPVADGAPVPGGRR